jgi:hypothetical protein
MDEWSKPHIDTLQVFCTAYVGFYGLFRALTECIHILLYIILSFYTSINDACQSSESAGLAKLRCEGQGSSFNKQCSITATSEMSYMRR